MADGQHDHHQKLTRWPCVVVFGVTTTLQRRAAAKGRRHKKMPGGRFLGRDPPVLFLQATRGTYLSARVKSTWNMKRSSDTPIQTHVSHVGTQKLAICHALRTLELELLKICSLKTTVSTLKEDRQKTTSVASKSSFFLAYGREVLFERSRPSNLDMFPRARS